MKLKVKNFGPIRKAEVELKPLTVFVGPGNTGKSYLAMLLYSAAKTMDSADRNIMWDVGNHFNEAFHKKQVPWREVVEDNKTFPPVVAKAMSLVVHTFRDVWAHEAQRCFGEEWETIAKSNGKWPVSVSIESDSGVVLDLLNPKKDKLPSTAKMVRHIRSELKAADARKGRRVKGGIPAFFDETGCAGILCTGMRLVPERPFSFSNKVHYLPAIRSGTMQRHRMMVSAIIGNAADISIFGRNLGESLNGVLADFLQKLVLVGNDKGRAQHRHRRRRPASGKPDNEAGMLSRTIEQEILRGEIVEDPSDTGYTDFRYKFASHGKERNIQLMNASSTISELAPLVIFMRHYLEPPGDIFIVEEPEAHLHPAAQRKIASVLAGLVKSGVYVVVTTHSDMILEQLSNFVHAHGYPETNLLNEKSGERTIHQNQTAVYSFVDTHPDKGTAVCKIDFNEDTGMVTRDHLDESSDLYNETVDIFNAKQEQAANDN